MRFSAFVDVFHIGLKQETRTESGVLIVLFSAEGVNGTHICNYVHVQLYAFLNYVG